MTDKCLEKEFPSENKIIEELEKELSILVHTFVDMGIKDYNVAFKYLQETYPPLDIPLVNHICKKLFENILK